MERSYPPLSVWFWLPTSSPVRRPACQRCSSGAGLAYQATRHLPPAPSRRGAARAGPDRRQRRQAYRGGRSLCEWKNARLSGVLKKRDSGHCVVGSISKETGFQEADFVWSPEGHLRLRGSHRLIRCHGLFQHPANPGTSCRSGHEHEFS